MSTQTLADFGAPLCASRASSYKRWEEKTMGEATFGTHFRYTYLVSVRTRIWTGMKNEGRDEKTL